MKLPTTLTVLFIAIFLSILVVLNAVRVPETLEDHANDDVNGNLEGGDYYHIKTLFPFKSENWEGKCFKDTYGFLTYSQDHRFASVYITARKARSWTCRDDYLYKVGNKTVGKEGIFSSVTKHKTSFRSDEDLRNQIHEEGVQVYMWKKGVTTPMHMPLTSSESKIQYWKPQCAT